MLRMLTYPTLMRMFVLNPTVDEIASELEDCEVKIDYSRDHLTIEHRPDVPDIFNRIMRSKPGFRISKASTKVTWQYTHYMKPSARYDHNRANVILLDRGEFYELHVSMITGTHRRAKHHPTIFGLLSFLSFFLILGFTGSYEQDAITLSQYILRSIMTLGVGYILHLIESRINPYDSVIFSMTRILS